MVHHKPFIVLFVSSQRRPEVLANDVPLVCLGVRVQSSPTSAPHTTLSPWPELKSIAVAGPRKAEGEQLPQKWPQSALSPTKTGS